MPGPAIQDAIIAPEPNRIRVNLAPAHNAFHSLMLLYNADELSGLGEWVPQTWAMLTPEEREIHGLVFNGLHYAAVPQRGWPSFPTYVDHLATMEPLALRDKMLRTYARIPPGDGTACLEMGDEPLPVDLDKALASVDAYLDFLIARFGAGHIDREIETRAYSLVVDPPAMQSTIVDHLRAMWDKYLAPEWSRVELMLQDAVRAFQQASLADKSVLEAAQWITGQELSEEKWQKSLAQAEQVIFAPSAHVGPYLGRLCSGKVLWVIFGARLPEGASFEVPDLSRAEILVRLNALADNNRLRILKWVAQRGEMSSQDLIASLELSQSTVSRHLKQLTATGYLSERRCNGAKCYALQPERIQNTLQAISAFLLDN
jgi:DNA-binding transcriptional ArsR family regulator